MDQHPYFTETIQRLQAELETLRDVYQRAKNRLAGKDPEWEIRRQRLEAEVFHAVKTFREDDPPSKAVYIIGKIQAAVKEMDQPRILVRDYETRRKRYAEACASAGRKATQF